MTTVTITPKNTESNLSIATQIAIDLINELSLDEMIDKIVDATGIPVENVEYEEDGYLHHFMICLKNEKYNLCYGFTNMFFIDIEDIEEYELEIKNNETQEWEHHYCENLDQVKEKLGL